MRIRLKAPAGMSTTGIYGANGTEVAVGEELDVEHEPLGWAGRYDIISGSTEGKEAVLNSYAVDNKGGGYYVITKDGVPVSKSLRKADVEGFDELSDEDKAAFADLHKAD